MIANNIWLLTDATRERIVCFYPPETNSPWQSLTGRIRQQACLEQRHISEPCGCTEIHEPESRSPKRIVVSMLRGTKNAINADH